MAEYRAAVQKELEDGVNEAAENQLYADAWNQVFESSEIIEYPEEDIDTAIEAYKELNGEYIEQAQMDMSEFLKSQGITEEEYRGRLQTVCGGQGKAEPDRSVHYG